jgi:hypothetical protein
MLPSQWDACRDQMPCFRNSVHEADLRIIAGPLYARGPGRALVAVCVRVGESPGPSRCGVTIPRCRRTVPHREGPLTIA